MWSPRRRGALARYVVTAATYAGILADLSGRMIPHGVGRAVGYGLSLVIGSLAAHEEKGGLRAGFQWLAPA